MTNVTKLVTANSGITPAGLGALLAAVMLLCFASTATAYRFETGPDWSLNLDTSLQYTVGMRVDDREDKIAGNPGFDQSDYLFDQYEVVTNRLQSLFEFQGVYKGWLGFRMTGSMWKDFALEDGDVEQNPNFPDSFNVYPRGTFSNTTKKFHIQGEELLDAFVFANFDAGDFPVSVKLGRLSQQWGNAFFSASRT